MRSLRCVLCCVGCSLRRAAWPSGSPSFSRPASFPETPRVVSSSSSSQSGTEKTQPYRQPSGSFSVPGSSGGPFAWYKLSPDKYVDRGGCPGPGPGPLHLPGFSLPRILFDPGTSLCCLALCVPLQFQGLGGGAFEVAAKGHAVPDLASPPG